MLFVGQSPPFLDPQSFWINLSLCHRRSDEPSSKIQKKYKFRTKAIGNY